MTHSNSLAQGLEDNPSHSSELNENIKIGIYDGSDSLNTTTSLQLRSPLNNGSFISLVGGGVNRPMGTSASPPTYHNRTIVVADNSNEVVMHSELSNERQFFRSSPFPDITSLRQLSDKNNNNNNDSSSTTTMTTAHNNNNDNDILSSMPVAGAFTSFALHNSRKSSNTVQNNSMNTKIYDDDDVKDTI
jgi:hypothetical protein